jgi:hypothetical protein
MFRLQDLRKLQVNACRLGRYHIVGDACMYICMHEVRYLADLSPMYILAIHRDPSYACSN